MREREKTKFKASLLCSVLWLRLNWTKQDGLSTNPTYLGAKPNKRHKPPHSVATVIKSTYNDAFTKNVGKETVF